MNYTWVKPSPHVPVVCQVVTRGNSEHRFSAHVLDLSMVSIGLQAARQHGNILGHGTRVGLRIHFPNDDRCVILDARVQRWIPSPNGVRIDLHVVDIDGEGRRLMGRYIWCRRRMTHRSVWSLPGQEPDE